MDWITAVLLVGFAAMFLVAAALYRASQENDDLLRDKLREIERDVAESAAKHNDELNAIRHKYAVEVGQHTATKRAYEAAIARHVDQLRKMQDEIDDADAALDAVVQKLDNMTDAYRRLLSEHDDAVDDLGTASHQLELATARLDAMREELNDVAKDRDAWKDDAELLRARCGALSAVVNVDTKALNAILDAVNAASDELQKLGETT